MTVKFQLPTKDGDIQQTTRYQVKCPHSSCKGLFDVTHQMQRGVPTKFGSWYCDQCGWATSFELFEDGKLKLQPENERKINTLVLLNFIGATVKDEPLFLVVDGMLFEKNGQINTDTQAYYYDEHTCPYNYLRAELLCGDDADPHGIFQHVATVVRPVGWEEEQRFIEDYYALFPALHRLREMRREGHSPKLIMAALTGKKEV